jgi:hypothetical protein
MVCPSGVIVAPPAGILRPLHKKRRRGNAQTHETVHSISGGHSRSDCGDHCSESVGSKRGPPRRGADLHRVQLLGQRSRLSCLPRWRGLEEPQNRQLWASWVPCVSRIIALAEALGSPPIAVLECATQGRSIARGSRPPTDIAPPQPQPSFWSLQPQKFQPAYPSRPTQTLFHNRLRHSREARGAGPAATRAPGTLWGLFGTP